MTFGQFLRELREESFGLREFAEKVDLKPSNLSAIENGNRKPPKQREVLLRIASALGLSKGSGDWNQFFDLARESNELPADVGHVDEVSLIPSLLRTIDQKQLNSDELRSLIDHIQTMQRLKASDHN